MEERNPQTSALISNFNKDYDADFNELRERLRRSLIEEGVFSQDGTTLVINTLESLKDTMNPFSHSVSNRYVLGQRKALAGRLGDLQLQILTSRAKYVNNMEELSLFLFRLHQMIFSFNDKWVGMYEKMNKGGGFKVIVKIKTFIVSLFTHVS